MIPVIVGGILGALALGGAAAAGKKSKDKK